MSKVWTIDKSGVYDSIDGPLFDGAIKVVPAEELDKYKELEKLIETDLGVSCPYCNGHFQNKETEELTARGFNSAKKEINRLVYELDKSRASHVGKIHELDSKLSQALALLSEAVKILTNGADGDDVADLVGRIESSGVLGGS